jgi:hypothetical protein
MYRKRRGDMKVIVIVGLLLGSLLISCSKKPTTLSEEEFIKVLAEVNQVGPLNFRRDVWPLLQKKTITYCGPLQESKVAGTESVLSFEVNKTYAEKKLPWLLEGRSTSPDLAPSYKAGEVVCMTGPIEGFTYHNPSYWGYVKIQSMEKPRTS